MTNPAKHNVVELAQSLVRFPSVTPDCTAVLDWAEQFLHHIGFRTQRLRFGPSEAQVDNLYARWGEADHPLLFCGHVDVVPVGDSQQWSVDPFAAVVVDERLIGRGAVDMKGNIAAYFSALACLIPSLEARHHGLAILLTGDEEGVAQYGVKQVIPHLVAAGERWSGCITGEPTSQHQVGDTYKHGRRGSLTGGLTLTGVQGHTGYPERAINAAHAMVHALKALYDMPLDQGCADFQPSWLAIASIDVDNAASNVIPAQAKALLNFRFNTQQTSAGLQAKAQQCVEKALEQANFSQVGAAWHWREASEPFLTAHSHFMQLITQAIHEVTGLEVQGSTSGGTSDSRFIHAFCPVIDFGLRGQGMHGVDESVALTDLYQLEKIYAAILRRYTHEQHSHYTQKK